MRKTQEKLNRDEALKRLHAFTAELEVDWKRHGLEWGFDLLTLVRLFTREASKAKPDPEQLKVLRDELRDFIGRHRFLKGLEFVLEWADSVIYEK